MSCRCHAILSLDILAFTFYDDRIFSYLSTKPLSHLRKFIVIQQFYLISSSLKKFLELSSNGIPWCSWRFFSGAQQRTSQQI